MKKASNLKAGEEFKLPGMRKWRQVCGSDPKVLQGPGIPPHHQGKMLVILHDCQQLILDPDRYVVPKVNDEDPDTLVTETRSCCRCVNFVEKPFDIPICKKKHMAVSSNLKVTFKMSEETCFKSNIKFLVMNEGQLFWVSCKMPPPAGVVVLGYSPDWKDSEINPEGVAECWIDDDGNWTYSKWCSMHDEWHLRTEDDPAKDGYQPPVHWMPKPQYAPFPVEFVRRMKRGSDIISGILSALNEAKENVPGFQPIGDRSSALVDIAIGLLDDLRKL